MLVDYNRLKLMDVIGAPGVDFSEPDSDEESTE
jgi:hypothetical protein